MRKMIRAELLWAGMVITGMLIGFNVERPCRSQSSKIKLPQNHHKKRFIKGVIHKQTMQNLIYHMTFSYDFTSGSKIAPCNKIDKPLVVYRFSGNVMTSITTLLT